MSSAFAAAGHECLEEPMLRIRWMSFDRAAIADATALVFTSANGVDAFVGQGGVLGQRMLYAVGSQTAARLTGHAARPVFIGDGDATSLLRLIYSTWKPASGKIVHVCGTHLSCNIAAELGQWGYATDRAVVYVAEPLQALTQRAIEALRRCAVDGIVFLSRRATETFCALPQVRAGSLTLNDVTAFCISENVADAVTPGIFRHVSSASHPTRAALLRLLSVATQGCGGMSPTLVSADQGPVYQT
ncbi:uroporphyrinogen-III synthase [Agrobacterium tumefaciens]